MKHKSKPDPRAGILVIIILGWIAKDIYRQQLKLRK